VNVVADWVVERRQGSERRPWLRIYAGPEGDAVIVYGDEASKLTTGELRLVDPEGKVRALTARSR
jgi:hypothetical protein